MVRATLPLHQAIAILRRTAVTDRSPVAKRSSEGMSRAGGSASGEASSLPRSHVADLGVRLQAARSAEPLQRAAVLRLFIEAVLLDELGTGMAIAAEFQDLVDQTVNALSEQESLRLLIDEALDELLVDTRRKRRR
jgi:hypothetical protein